MLFRKASSPFVSAKSSVNTIMYQVLFELITGTVDAIYFFGWGVLINLMIAAVVCLLSEALVLKLRTRPVEAQAGLGRGERSGAARTLLEFVQGLRRVPSSFLRSTLPFNARRIS